MRRTLFAAALTIRLAAIFATGAGTIRFGDGIDYIDTAKAFCATGSYPLTGSLPFFRAPGLPFFIALVTACHPAAVVAIKIGLAVCDSLTVVLISSLLPLPAAAGRGAGVRGLIAALNPFFILGVCDVRSEPLFMTLLTLAIWCLLRGREGGAGVAVALASLVRPAGLLCIPLFALYRPRRAWVLLLASALTLAPWTIRNALRFHELIVVNDAGGFNFWRGYAPEIIAIDAMTDRDAIARASWEFDARRVAEARKTMGREGWVRAGLDEIRRDPAAAARWTLRKAWLYWRPWLSPTQYSWPAVLASGAFNILLYVLAVVALARWPDRRFAVAVVIYLVVIWLAHLPYQVVMRFRQPFTDPLLIALAASAGTVSAPRTIRAGADRENRSAAPVRP